MKKVLLATAALALMAIPAMSATGPTPTVLSAGGGVNTGLYHSYDGLVCTDCHTLHNSEDAQAIAGAKGSHVAAPNQALLKKADYTDVCLSCHKEQAAGAGPTTSATADMNGVSNSGWKAPIVMTFNGTAPSDVSMPGGDFYWSNLDAKKGHNPSYTKGSAVATSQTIAGDPTLTNIPPGNNGNPVGGEWSCHSCHGMHSRYSGSYTAWRQLNRKVNGIVVSGDVSGQGVETTAGNKGATAAGYEPILSNSRGDVQGTSYLATRKDGNPLEGANLFAAYGDSNKNVYRGGFSSFCSACHGNFHGGKDETLAASNGNTSSGGKWLRHPTNVKLSDNAQGEDYTMPGAYAKAQINSQGTNPNPVGYDFKYPLVQPDSDFTVKVDAPSASDAATAVADDRIMCLTCHKAHATQYNNATRWDTNHASFLKAGDTDIDGTVAAADNTAFGCGKCHQKGGNKAFIKAF